MAFTAAVALFLVVLGFCWILLAGRTRDDMQVALVSLQAVEAESMASEPSEGEQHLLEFEQLAASSGQPLEELTQKIDVPELPTPEDQVKPEELLGNQADSDKTLEETDAALRQAGELLRKLLEASQNRGQGAAPGAGESGKQKGQMNPDSTPGRQARWIITYPTLPQGEYERMLDSFGIELAYLQLDHKNLQYLGSLAAAGKKYIGPAADEDRMFWYWMGQNRLRDVDEAILRKHGLEPTSEVVHLYTKHLEQELAQKEREYLRRQWRQTNIELIAQTNFRILPGGPGGWHLAVSGMVLK
jgi:hypothetical protein